jgi:DNA excision repair protein ERCC-3
VTAHGSGDEPIAIEDFYDALQDRGRPVVTASEVARFADCSQAAAAEALSAFAEEGRLERLAVDADPVVWFPSDYRETASQERISVFPRRREIVADRPAQFTRAQLSQFAHLEDTNREGAYRYTVREQDVWRAPAETRDDLLATVRSALGGRYEALEEWIGGHWDRAHRFRLRTHEDGYVVLAAETADLLGNVAEQHLEDGVIRARIDDDVAWVAADRTAELKRTLYAAGYPVQDRRELDTGDDLPVELTLELRPYQADWVARFADAGSGVLSGRRGPARPLPPWPSWPTSRARRWSSSRRGNSRASGGSASSPIPPSPPTRWASTTAARRRSAPSPSRPTGPRGWTATGRSSTHASGG